MDFGLLAVVSAYDMGFESLEDTINLLEKMLDSIELLTKWNGHLYNWYNLKNLEPLVPRYISSVDSGNFVGYLYVLRQFYEDVLDKNNEFSEKVKSRILQINRLIENTNFSVLYDEKTRLFSIGFNVEENKLTDSYYDLLASEARQASLIAIAKKDVSAKHWYNLSRTLTILNRYKGLISWSGTAFEYLMPNVNIPRYPASILDESCKFMIMSQKEYSKKLGIPWGISESAFNLRDLSNNYQYKAFGIPWLGLKRGLEEDIVVSSYGSILAIADEPKDVISNLKVLEGNGMLDKYGFYESIDYTPERLGRGKLYETVKTYMAHHQGLILLSINNLVNNKIIQDRFIKNPEISAVKILLEERMPENVIITKKEKEKPEKKIKYKDDEVYTERTYQKVSDILPTSNVISDEDYTIVMDTKGEGYSKFNDILINRYKETDEVTQGIYFYIKNITTKRIWTSNYSNCLPVADKYKVSYTQDMCKITRVDGGIETKQSTIIAPKEPVEIRNLELTNNTSEEETLEITSFLEPVISSAKQDYSHMAFNKLFLTYEYDQETQTILVKRKQRDNNKKDMFLGVNLYTREDTIGELEFEIDKEKFNGRANYNIPKLVENSSPFSNKIRLTVDPIVAMRRTIKLKPGEKKQISLIITVAEDKEVVKKRIENYLNEENIQRAFKLSRARVEAENRYVGLKGKQIDVFQKLLGYLIYKTPITREKIRLQKNEKFEIRELWKFGISGDLPILLVTINNVSDIDTLEEIVKAYDYFRLKNIQIDFVILNGETSSYENYVKDEINRVIANKNLAYMQNKKGGIFVLNNIEEKDRRLLFVTSNISLDCHKGSLRLQLQDLEEEYIERVKNVSFELPKPVLMEDNQIKKEYINNEKLKYYNDFGGFSEDGREYVMKQNTGNRLPNVWSHILANEKFGTLVTDSYGGYTWSKNCRLNRITSFSNNSILDIPSEIIFLEDTENNKKWSLGASPMPDEHDYYTRYGFGYAKYFHTSDSIEQELTVFVPKVDSVKINILNLKNLLPRRRKIKLVYYVKLVMDEDEVKSKGYVNVSWNENSNILCAKNLVNSEFNTIAYIGCSEKISSYTGDKKFFFGNGNLSNPEGLKAIELNRKIDFGNNEILAIQINLELEAYESKEISLLLGAENSDLDCQDKAYQYMNLNYCKTELSSIKKYWSEILDRVKIKTPLESTNIILNGWLIYQNLSSRLWAKTGFYQSGGAYGFRDQLQDCIALKYVMPELVRRQIIKHAKHQFVEGDVEHWWHEDTQKGIRTRFSDDLLWLPYVVSDYIQYTNDYSILDEKCVYIYGEQLEEGVDERYDKYEESNITGSIYEHCIKAIDYSLKFGENGLPKIGSGDWNDGFSTVGNKGKGESVWLGFFIYTVLNDFIPICERLKENDKVEQYNEVIIRLKKVLNTKAWDGRWYKRAFMDDGNALGSIQNEECRIDSISQSWAVISGAGDNDKKYISMESLENHLIDKENGIIKLLDPPFEKSKIEPGYIKAYVPGTRENGGQYTHASCWAIIAEAILGFGDKALEYFRMINPIEHARTKEQVTKYKAEPYVIPADIYGQGNLAGRGGWTWYTGSSSWMYEAGLKYILGLKIQNGYLTINPCIPSDWQEYQISYMYKSSIYNVKVINPNKKCYGIESFKINGEEIEEKKIRLDDSGKVLNIEVVM